MYMISAIHKSTPDGPVALPVQRVAVQTAGVSRASNTTGWLADLFVAERMHSGWSGWAGGCLFLRKSLTK